MSNLSSVKMTDSKILLLYKKTVYARYKNRHIIDSAIDQRLLKDQLFRLRHAHEEHTGTLTYVKEVLRKYRLDFAEFYRGGKIPFKKYDIIISVGGDGTFLKAAAGATHQLIIGVNSAPVTSVGRLCVARRSNFDGLIQRLINRDVREVKWQRLMMSVSNGKTYHVMNDVLFAHTNPAVISRYLIKSGRAIEEQRSSGVWVSTAIGSTGAIGSAGGRKLKPESKEIQFLSRELYPVFGRKYQLRGGILSPRSKLTIHSLMPLGHLFIDGGNQTVPLAYGQSCEFSLSRHPIRTLTL